MQRNDFDFARVKQEFLPLTIKDVVVEREKSARILGLIVQDNLKWNGHGTILLKRRANDMLRVFGSDLTLTLARVSYDV